MAKELPKTRGKQRNGTVRQPNKDYPEQSTCSVPRSKRREGQRLKSKRSTGMKRRPKAACLRPSSALESCMRTEEVSFKVIPRPRNGIERQQIKVWRLLSSTWAFYTITVEV